MRRSRASAPIAGTSKTPCRSRNPSRSRSSTARTTRWRPERSGETLTVKLPVEKAGDYEVIGYFTKAPDYANILIKLGDGEAKEVSLFSPRVEPSGKVSLGKAKLSAGANPITIQVVG